MYTEDGAWISKIINEGFVHTLFHARGDYLVFGNVILLQVAFFLNTLVCGKNLCYLPVFVALVQYSFFSLAALLPVSCFRRDLSLKYRIMLWILILLVPLGDTGFEVLGKISNTGYLFYFVALCLLYERIFNHRELSRVRIIVIDIVLFICCGTNESCYILVGLAFCLDVWMTYKGFPRTQKFSQNLAAWFSEFRNKAWIALGVMCSLIAAYDIFFLKSGATQLFDGGNSKNAIEFFARALLFYFVYPFYSQLQNHVVIFVFLITLFALLIFLVHGKSSSLQKLKLSVLVMAALLYAVIAFIFRYSLTMHLDNYTTSWVDRYYYAINITAILPAIYAAELLAQHRTAVKRVASACICFALVFPAIISVYDLFQYDDPQTNSVHCDPFIERILQAERGTDSNYGIPIDSNAWIMWVPKEYIIASQLKQRDGKLRCMDFSDSNWTNGMLNDDHTVLLFGYESGSILSQCRALQAGGVTVEIQEIKDMYPYIWVICDGNADAFVYPNEIEMIFDGGE